MHKHRLSSICIFLFGTLMALAAAASSGGGGGPSPSSKKDPAPYYQRGLEKLKAGDYAAAQKEFKEVLKIVPDNAQARYLMGRAQEGAQDFKAALRSYKKAGRSDRKLYDAKARAGILSLALDERGDAEDDLADLRQAKARCASCAVEEQAQIQSAIDALDAALKGKATGEELGALPGGRADGERRYLVAIELIHREQFAQAVQSLRASEAAFGPNADILNYLGYAHRKLKHYDNARRYYAQALAIDPLHRGANEYLGELHIETGRLDLALAQLETLRRLCAFGCAEEEELRRWIARAH